jgi:hypothetical protein
MCCRLLGKPLTSSELYAPNVHANGTYYLRIPGFLIITLLLLRNLCLPKHTASSLYGDLELWSTLPTLASRRANAYMATWLPRDTSLSPCHPLMSISTRSSSQGRIFLPVKLYHQLLVCPKVHILHQTVDHTTRSPGAPLIPCTTHHLLSRISQCYIDHSSGRPTGAKIGYSLHNIGEPNEFYYLLHHLKLHSALLISSLNGLPEVNSRAYKLSGSRPREI